jgi:hypothetical protein
MIRKAAYSFQLELDSGILRDVVQENGQTGTISEIYCVALQIGLCNRVVIGRANCDGGGSRSGGFPGQLKRLVERCVGDIDDHRNLARSRFTPLANDGLARLAGKAAELTRTAKKK